MSLLIKYVIILFFFKVNANFTTVYRNYTTRSILNSCIIITVLRFTNYRNFTTMFYGVTCEGSNLSNIIYKSMYVSKRLEYCLNGTEIHNVTTSSYSEMEQYCGKLSLSLFLVILSLSLLRCIDKFQSKFYKKKSYIFIIILVK